MTGYGAACDRCGQPYIATSTRHNCLCPSCHLGMLSPAERGLLLGHLTATGRKLT